jgi:serine/threonine-protein phosphatase 2A regulatory subunit B''
VTKKFWLHQTRIGLSLYDGAGLGYLKESDLENYIFELIPTLPQLEVLERSFYSFYVCTAVRKFFFFLDPLRSGKVKITEILASGFLDQLIELRDEELCHEHPCRGVRRCAARGSVVHAARNLMREADARQSGEAARLGA